MSILRSVTLDLEGELIGGGPQLSIALLPGVDEDAKPDLLLDVRGVPGRDETLEPVQLLEGMEYRFELSGFGEAGPVSTDRPEVFAPDDHTGRTGRLRTGLYTGSMQVAVFQHGTQVGKTRFEVRSRKLNYLTDYRQMLTDIAELASEAVMERFGTSEQAFAPDAGGDPRTIYQRFAFLQSLLSTEAFNGAVSRVIARPYELWHPEVEIRDLRRGLKGVSHLAKQLSGPGRRLDWPDGPLENGAPARVSMFRSEATLDNPPNRFVKFALVTWRATVQRLADGMRALPDSPAARRGILESQTLLNRIDALLGEEVFREIGELRFFPSGNQALQKREGYRDIFRAYVLFELAARLAWSGGEDVYEAGQRDVATLYEYWCYLRLARLVSDLCEVPLDFASLLAVDTGELSLQLRKGRRQVLAGQISRLGRDLTVELWYNRWFGSSQEASEGSWTVRMRPDFSIRITPERGDLEECEPVWVHFDAKYRLQRIEDIVGPEAVRTTWPEDIDSNIPGLSAEAKRDDLLKMHAYRDAIRRSAGAYVLYPGDLSRTHQPYEEVLPGLGAFTLRPGITGVQTGDEHIRAFLEAVLVHTADQASNHERERFWRARIRRRNRPRAPGRAAYFLRTPPADTRVLIGFVKSLAHLTWVHATHLYNLRADERRGSISRELLEFELLLLWGAGLDDSVELWRIGRSVTMFSADELIATGYPEPRGRRYYCVRLSRQVPDSVGQFLNRRTLENLLWERAPSGRSGAPVLLTWSDLHGSID